jgi:hypothetical protein
MQVVLSICLAVGASFTYNTPLLLLPFCSLVIPFWQGIPNWRRWLPISVALVVVFVTIWTQLAPLTSQKKGITLLSDEHTQTQYREYRASLRGWQQKILGNRYLYFGTHIAGNVVKSFSPSFLVTQGGSHPWHSLPNWGHFWWSLYFLGMLGMVGCFAQLIRDSLHLNQNKSRNNRLILTQNMQSQCALLLLTISALAPSVITVDAPHTTRSLVFLFLWCYWAAYGLEIGAAILTFVAKKTLLYRSVTQVFYGAALILLCISSIEFLHTTYSYFWLYPANYPGLLQVGFNTVLKEAEKKYPTIPIAIVDPDGFHYILTSWYLELPAQKYFQTTVRQQKNHIGFRYGQQVDRYHFIGHINDRDTHTERVVIFWEPEAHQWHLNEL